MQSQSNDSPASLKTPLLAALIGPLPLANPLACPSGSAFPPSHSALPPHSPSPLSLFLSISLSGTEGRGHNIFGKVVLAHGTLVLTVGCVSRGRHELAGRQRLGDRLHALAALHRTHLPIAFPLYALHNSSSYAHTRTHSTRQWKLIYTTSNPLYTRYRPPSRAHA